MPHAGWRFVPASPLSGDERGASFGGGVMSRMIYVPRPFEKVLVAGRHHVCLVISVDQDKRTADLMELSEGSCVLKSVPFSALRRFREDMPAQAA